jgi:uncharacterized Zn finger protein
MVACPRCGQGSLELVKFGRRALVVKKCYECDAVWASTAGPSRATFVQFQVLLDILGESEADTPYEVIDQNQAPRPPI